MFDFKKIMKLTAIVAVAMTMASCAGKKELASKGNMIPEGSVFAMKVDANQLWDKAMGEPGSPAHQLWGMAKMGLNMQLPEMGELGQKIREMVDDPATLGIAVDEPVVVSVNPTYVDVQREEFALEAYMVALLDNSEAFISVLDAAVAFVQEEEDFTVTKTVVSDNYTHYEFLVDEEGTLDLGVSDESVVLRLTYTTIPSTEPVDLKASLPTLFANGGPADSEGLEDFYASQADLATWMDMEPLLNMCLPILDMVEPGSSDQLKAYMPMYKGASFVADLTFKPGQTVLQFKVFGSEEMKAYAQKYNAVASDKYFKYLPASSVLVCNVALKDLAGLVKEMGAMNEQYAMVFNSLDEDFGFDEQLLAGLPGVITFALDGKDVDQREIPGFVAFAECDRNVWEFVEDYLAEVANYECADTYCIEGQMYIGYADGGMYIADASNYTMNNVKSYNFSDTKWADVIAKGGAVVDLEVLPASLLDSLASEVEYYMTGRELLEYVNSVVITSSDDHMQATLTLNMGDKEHNLLEKLVLEAVSNIF